MKGFIIKHVSAEHPAVMGGRHDDFYAVFPKDAQVFIRRCCPDNATRAFVAYYKGKIVAFLRYRVVGGKLAACGTWVHAKFRRRRLATELWRRLAKMSTAAYLLIDVVCISRASWRMIHLVAAEFPQTGGWKIEYQ